MSSYVANLAAPFLLLPLARLLLPNHRGSAAFCPNPQCHAPMNMLSWLRKPQKTLFQVSVFYASSVLDDLDYWGFSHAENRKEAISRPPSRGSASEKPTDASPRRHRAGEVPSYLLERKEQWAAEEEAKIKAAGDPDCPPGTPLSIPCSGALSQPNLFLVVGMVVMPDSERLSTLEVLQNNILPNSICTSVASPLL